MVVWYFHLLKNFPQFVLIYPVNGFDVINKAEAGNRIARRNINNLRYTDDPTLMSESKEELKSLLLRVKGETEKLA